MKSTLGVVAFFYLLSGFAFAHDGSQCNVHLADDAFIKESLQKYSEAFHSADSNAIIDWSVTQQAYDALLQQLKNKNLACLTEFDKTYSVRSVVDEFNQSCKYASGYQLDSIAAVKASWLKGCGDVSYKKIDAKIFFRKDQSMVELPLALVFLEDANHNFKLMMQITNYKILQNEQ